MPDPPAHPIDQIDFLPPQYRKRDVRRRTQPWRVVVVAAFAVLLTAAVVGQCFQRRRVEEQLAAMMPVYESAVAQSNRLAKIQTQLRTSRTSAELFTYLRHPWPRTQLLAALAAPLPDEVSFDEVTISRVAPRDRPQIAFGRNPQTAADDEAKIKKLPPAARDLKRLREAVDKLQTIVLISGTTTDSAVLHRYLGELNRFELFSTAEVDWIEADQSPTDGRQKFSAMIVVRPGYGQPGGPTAPCHDALAQSKTGARRPGGPRRPVDPPSHTREPRP